MARCKMGVSIMSDTPLTPGEQFNLMKLLEWAGYAYGDFHHLTNAETVTTPVVLQLGRGEVLDTRGYVRPGPNGTHAISTLHPTFIRAGQSKLSAAFINDVQKAVKLAADGLPIEATSYVIDPLPRVALEWARDYVGTYPRHRHRLSYDIETPGPDKDEVTDADLDDQTYHIFRIGFAHAPLGALTVPWTPEYMAAIRLLMEFDGEKVVWNAGFDNPRIRFNGVGINGTVHDAMVAWHVLHSDLPKNLGFVATFTCPWQHEWKSMSHRAPGLYNCIDADVELRSMLAIESELRRTGLWQVYDEDVLQLDPILHFMQTKGMPVDEEVRYEKVVELDKRLRRVTGEIETLVPTECRTFSPKNGYIKPPLDPAGLIAIGINATVRRCSRCGLVNPTKPHFKTLKKPTASRPQNPCSAAEVVTGVERVERYARLDDFKISRNLLLRYQDFYGRIIPTKWDSKTKTRRPTTDEKALKTLIRKYPDDPLYAKVLEQRELDKLAGTYLGRPA